MAESYRGLTIRIGGDTTKLSQALRSANQAISGTNQELRKLGQALKLDPSNAEAYTQQLSYMANQADNTAMRLAKLKAAREELAKRSVRLSSDPEDVTSLRELSDATENASQSAVMARASAAQLSAELAKMHNVVSALSADAAKVKANEFSKAFDLSAGTKSIEDIRSELEKAFGGIEGADEKIRTTTNLIQGLAKAFDFDNGMVDLDVVRTIFDDLPSHIRPTEKEIDAIIAEASKLKQSYLDAAETMRSAMSAGDAGGSFDGIADRFKDAYGKANSELSETIGSIGAKLLAEYKVAIKGVEDETERSKITERFDAKFEAAFEKARQSANRSFSGISEKFGKEFSAAIKDTESEMDRIAQSYQKIMSSATSFAGIKVNDVNGNTSSDQIRDYLEGMADDIGLAKPEIDEIVEEVERLIGLFAQADREAKNMNLVEGFQDALVEITKAQASINNISHALADMNVPSELLRGLVEITANVEHLNGAYKTLMDMGKSLMSGFDANPENVSSLEGAFKAFAAAEMVAVENAERLRKEIAAYDVSEIEAGTDASKSAAQQLYDASNAAEKAKASLATINGNIKQLEADLTQLGNKASQSAQAIGSSEGAAEKAASADEAIAKSREKINAELAKYLTLKVAAEQAERESSDELELAKKRQEYENLTLQAQEWRNALIAAQKAETDATKRSAVTTTVGPELDDVRQLATEFETATSRAKALGEALRLDPGNKALQADKVRAFADAEQVAAKYAEALGTAIEKLDGSKVDSLRSRYGSLSNAVSQTTDAVNNTKAKLADARIELDRLTSGKLFDGIRDDVRDTGREISMQLPPNIEAARQKVILLEKAVEELKGDMNDAAKAKFLEDLGQQLDGIQAKINGAIGGAGIDQAAFQQAFNMVTQYAERAGRAIVDSANTIDSAYRDMRKTVNGTEEDFESLRNAAFEFSQTHITSADTILEIEALGGQLGVAASKLQDFGEVISSLDIATDMDAEDLALKFGQLQNVMGDFDDTNFQNAADAVVRLGNNMAAQESSIINVAQRMSSVANVAKMSTSDLLALSASVASTGQRSESAATAVSNTMTGIAQAVASGGKSLQGFADIANMSAIEFANAWRENPTDALKAFVTGLQNLSDSNTEAIAALEEMGISSVRQETALLGLASTMDTLDNALEMSSNAWNGVSDQWGQAGDAANEAQKKSEGFSGALGILQNNVSNLAASFGDSLVPVMKTLSDAVKVITDALNMLSTPIKTALVTISGIAIAGGAAYTIIKTLAGGFIDLATSAGGLGGILPSVTSGISSIVTSMFGASSAATALGSALATGLVGAGIVVALSAIGLIVGAITDWMEHTENLEKATSGLVDTLDTADTAYQNYAAKADAASKSVAEVKENVDKVVESQAKLTDSMNERWEQVAVNAAMVDNYAQKISELTEKQSLNKEEQAELTAAVEAYNELTGESVEILDAESGQLDTNTQSILDNAEAWKKRAESEAAYEMYKDAVKAQMEAELELVEVNERLDAAQRAASMSSAEMYNGYSAHAGEIATLTGKQRELNDIIDAAKMTQSGLVDRMQTTESTMVDVERTLNSVGRSLQDYGNLTKSEMKQIVDAYNGSATSAINALNKIKSAQQSATISNIASTLSATNVATKDQVAAQKKANTEAYNSAKSMYDAEYDQAKSTYDKIYKARSKELDAAYKSTSKALDKEYKAAQKASQKYLKEYKSAQDEQVKAFKDATSQRIKLIDEEYEAKKKLLEDEYSKHDTGIDDRIAAIEAEQDAEDRAKKQREREDKIAELQQAVNRAKTNKKRAEAQKELNEYLAEIEAEYRKEDRQAQIEALKQQKSDLKDELSDKQQILKDSYDTATESYKSSREAELEILQKALTAAYEMESESQSERLEALKESNSERLEAIKDANNSELEALKQSQSAALDQMKSMHDSALEQLKSDNDTMISEMEDGTREVLDNIDNAIEQAASEIPELGELIKAGLINISEDGVVTFSEEMMKLPGVTSDTMDHVLNSLREAMPDMRFTAGNMTESILGPLERTVSNAGIIGRSIITSVANGLYDRGLLSKSMRDILDNVGSSFEQMAASGRVWGQNVSTEFANGVSYGMESVENSTLSLHSTARRVLDVISRDFGIEGESSAISYGNGIYKQSGFVASASADLVNAANRTLSEGTRHAITSGANLAINFANGIAMNTSAISKAASSAATAAAAYLHHSVPDKGALKDDDRWGGDLVQNIIDGMREQEGSLAAQAKRMAEIVENGFDPHMSLNAAFDAIDRIDAGKLRREQLVAQSSNIDQSTYAPVINITIPEMVIREQADVDLVSREVATRVQRALNSRIG